MHVTLKSETQALMSPNNDETDNGVSGGKLAASPH